MAERKTQSTTIALIQQDIEYMKGKFDDIKDKLDDVDTKLSSSYVSKEEFEPVKRLVYGLVSIILVSVVGAVMALILRT